VSQIKNDYSRPIIIFIISLLLKKICKLVQQRLHDKVAKNTIGLEAQRLQLSVTWPNY